MMSQSVGRGIDIPHGIAMRERFGAIGGIAEACAQIQSLDKKQNMLDMIGRLGTLKAGKLADIAVLDRNVFAMPLKDVKEVKVCLTISGGRVVYENL